MGTAKATPERAKEFRTVAERAADYIQKTFEELK
jgi:hypothetical protein